MLISFPIPAFDLLCSLLIDNTDDIRYNELEIRTCGGIGRHAGFRFQSARVQVQVLSGAPSIKSVKEKNPEKVALLEQKLDTYAGQNASDILIEALQWMDKNDAESPFDMPGITDQYFESANKKLAESQELLEEGRSDNAKGDAYNLVSVIYSLVLFLLGIVGIFKRLPNRAVVLIIAGVGLVLTTIYMLTIPMPTGFNLLSFISL